MNYEIRQKARIQIKQNKLWLSLGIIISIFTIVSALIGAILSRTPLTNITVLVAIVLDAICVNYSYNIVSGRLQPRENFSDQTNTIMSSLSKRTFLMIVLVTLYKAGWLLLFGLTTFFVSRLAGSQVSTVILILGFIVSMAIYIVKAYSYFLAPYLSLLDDGTLPSKITLSKQLMNGNKTKLFLLDLSMIPWYLLTAVTFGVAMVYTMPYITFVRANFAHKIIMTQNQA